MAAHLSLGVVFHPKFPPEMLVDYARRAEAGGFDEVWLWEDSFFAGAFTSAATMLAGTQKIKVGIGIAPATVRNPLFTAMEITTLARLYPGRFLPGFGHGVEAWMKQIGAAPSSSLKALEETVTAVRRLLGGESVTLQGSHVQMQDVSLKLVPDEVPPVFIGGIREKSLRLAGRCGDGTILTEMSSPAYVRWAGGQIAAGMAESGSRENHRVVYALCKVDPEGGASRAVARQAIAQRLEWSGAHLSPLGVAAEGLRLVREHGVDGAARLMPEAWVDDLSISGAPAQATAAIHRLAEAGADSIVLVPMEGDPNCLDEYVQYLLPVLQPD